MKWLPLALRLAEEAEPFTQDIAAFQVGSLQRPEALEEFLLDADGECASELEAAIRRRAQGVPWPELTPVQRLLLYQRIRHALSHLSRLDIPANAPAVCPHTPASPWPTLLIWLLSEEWESGRRERLREAARELTE